MMSRSTFANQLARHNILLLGMQASGQLRKQQECAVTR